MVYNNTDIIFKLIAFTLFPGMNLKDKAMQILPIRIKEKLLTHDERALEVIIEVNS